MRERLEDSRLFNPLVEVGWNLGNASLAITGNVTIPTGTPPVLSYNPSNTNRTITLPAAPASAAGGQQGTMSNVLIIRNSSSGTGILTIQDPTGPTTLGSITPGTIGIFISIGTSWFLLSSSTGGGAGQALTDAYNTNSSATSTTLTGANITGGIDEVTLNMTGALGSGQNITLPTVAALVTAMQTAGISPIIGMTYKLCILNTSSGAFAWTVLTNTGWTLNGTMTIAQNTRREFYVTLTSLAAATLQSLGQVAVASL